MKVLSPQKHGVWPLKMKDTWVGMVAYKTFGKQPQLLPSLTLPLPIASLNLKFTVNGLLDFAASSLVMLGGVFMDLFVFMEDIYPM